MRKLSWIVALTIAVSLVLPLFAAAAATEIEAEIASKIVDVFGDDGKGVRVTFVDGKAILTGKTTSRATQELAEEVALYFPEVKKVDNQLKASDDRGLGKGQLKDESLDAALESAAKGALAAEIGEYAKNIEVEAAEGAVSLRGTVPDEARYKLAVEAMKRVKDCSKVVDLLRVK